MDNFIVDEFIFWSRVIGYTLQNIVQWSLMVVVLKHIYHLLTLHKNNEKRDNNSQDKQ